MNKLWVRLSITFTLMVMVAVLIVVTAGYLLNRVEADHDRLEQRFFTQPNGLVPNLARYYQQNQSWQGVGPLLAGAQTVYFRPDAFVLADAQRRVVHYIKPEMVGQPVDRLNPRLVIPIRVNGQTVGYFGATPLPADFPKERRPSPFVSLLVNSLLTVAAVGGVSGVIFGVLISRSLTAPLNSLAQAARDIGARRLYRRVEEKGTDEIIAVARAFNEMAAQLEQAEQLRRNLLADVAHELRTPLSVLQGNLRAILDEVYPLEQAEIARLYEHTRLLSRLVNDLHELAQAEARQLPLDIQPTDINRLVAATVETFHPSAEAKGVRLEMLLAEPAPTAAVDAGRIRQVLQNLLANALRHTPEGGVIRVRVAAEASAVRVSIADTGDGIAPEHLPHIFDRFYRTDPARTRDRGGAGVGLAIARASVEAHGGQIAADSAGPGRGSEFTVQLPRTTSGR
ncbi:MAG: HAMP domain-containing protein [Chloroflexi bacterium]|nr:MAG: HAMP domain-containing protein [Chloroflexota bacterium]